MATNTEVVGNGYGRWKIEVTQTSTNYSANTSVVRVRGTMINEGTARAFNNSGPGMSISGSGSWSSSSVDFDCAANGGSDLVIDESFTITHASNGTKTVSFTITYNATGTSTFGGPESSAVSLGLTNHAQVPDIPAPSASSIGSTSAIVTCTVPDANYSTIDDYDIQVDNNSDFSSPVGTYARGGSVTGLTPGVVYYMRSRAHNGIGWSGWSTGTYTFTTLATVPSAVPAPTISNITSTGANVTWSTPSSNGSPITGYTVQYATNTSFTGATSVAATGSPKSITGLAVATTYYVRVLVTNAIGTTTPGAGVYATFTTGATVPGLPTAVGPVAGSITPTTASVQYTAPSNDGGSNVTGYTIQVASDSGFTTDLQTITDTASPTPIPSLSPGTLYYVRVRANNSVGNGSYTTAVTFTTLAGTPVITSPTSGQTVTTGVAIARVVVTAEGMKVGSVINAQFSKDNTFATGVVTASLTIATVSGTNSYTVTDSTKYLSVGTWYVRTQTVTTSPAYTSPWSTTVSFVESHTPSGSVLTPTAGSVIAYTATTSFTWSFSDLGAPYDLQTSYRLVIEDNTTGASIYDSGKLALATTAAVPSSTVSVAVGAGNKNNVLRWRVMVWDIGDTPSAWSGYGLFTVADAPTVNVTAPAEGEVSTTGAPVFTWTATFFAGGTQANTVVSVHDVSSGELVWTKTIAGVVLTTTPPTTVLSNGKSYFVSVTITDSHGIVGTDSNNFSTSYVSPPSVAYSADVTNVETTGYVNIAWYDFDPDPGFVKWNIYRRIQTESTWTLLAVLTDVNARDFKDYLFQSSFNYVYSVTQVAIRSGEPVEGPVGFYAVDGDTLVDNRTVNVDVSHYWLIDAVDNDNAVIVPGVVSDNSSLAFEKEMIHVIGRGMHADYGDELGYSGSLESKVRSPERISSFRLTMETMRRSKRAMYLRTPFGRTFKVSLGDISWNPLVGTGVAEMGDMSIPYEEVY